MPDDREETRRWKSDHPPDVITASYSAAYDEARLRRCLAQLTEAVHALHRHNVLHRDLKPSNVMIGSDERLRVLDYGLAAPLGREGLHISSDEVVVGTPGYMSPEQAEGVSIAAASDWYSVGAMLFEALTGKLPFEGSARDVLWKKVHEDGPDPRIHDRDLPGRPRRRLSRALEEGPGGAAALRGSDPRRRPDPRAQRGPGVRGRRRVRRPHATSSRSSGAPPTRSTEGSVVVHVQGPSGVGKSALVRRFVEDVERNAVVLAGRCFERESVPFKALDSLVDALTQYLRGLPQRRGRRARCPSTPPRSPACSRC